MNSEKNEIPKAMQNTNNNTDKVEDIKQKEKTKQSFIKKYIIFIILLIAITAGAIALTIVFTSKPNEEKIEDNNEIIQTEQAKKKAEDAKYGIEKYSETYDENDIKIINYVDVDGNVDSYEYTYLAPQGDKRIEFIQIEGLKDKDVQNIINEKLKKAAYEINMKNVYENVTANFSNVLSVLLIGNNPDEEFIRNGLNINLATGEDIKFEDIFVSSATINSYISEGLYKTLAWNEKSENATEESFMENFDMDKIQVNDFEEKLAKVIKNYNKAVKDGTINYSISPTEVSIYGIIDKSIVKNQYLNYIDMEFTNKREEVAIYKRFLKNESIFENNNIGQKGVIVFTNPKIIYDINYFELLNYGKIKDNIFMEDVIENYNDQYKNDEGYLKTVEYFKKDSDQKKNSISVESSKGMFYQRIINIWKDEQKHYFVATITEIETTCDISYYNDLAFKDYIDMKNQPSGGGIGYYIFQDNDYEKEQYPNLAIKGTFVKSEFGYDTHRRMYFNENGEYIGETKEEANTKTQDNSIEIKENISNETKIENENPQEKLEIDNTSIDTNQIKEEDNKNVEEIENQIKDIEESIQTNTDDEEQSNKDNE